MRRLLPDVADVPVEDVYDDVELPGDAGPYVVLGMVSSVDGAASLTGTTSGIGGAGDRAALVGLRGHADVILAGAETVRREDYGPPAIAPHRRERRLARGQAAAPRLAIVSARLDLDPAARVFSDPARRPVVVTTDAVDVARRERIEAVADVLVVGSGARVPLPTAVQELAGVVGPRIVCEGGPSLAGQLIAAGLVAEVFVTVAAILVGGPAPRLLTGLPEQARPLRLVGLHSDGTDVLLRYRMDDPSGLATR